jgi:hypothetical protein
MADNLALITFEFIAPIENNLNGGDYTSSNDTFNAYWDVRRYSIGYGTISYYGEQITGTEAKRRSIEHIERDINTLTKLFPIFTNLNKNQQIAVLSYAYQYGVGGFLKSQFKKKIEAGEIITEDWAKTLDYSSRRIKEVKKYNSPVDFEGKSIVAFIIALILLKVVA